MMIDLPAQIETELPGVALCVKNLGSSPIRIKERGAGGGMGRGLILEPEQSVSFRDPAPIDAYCDEVSQVAVFVVDGDLPQGRRSRKDWSPS